MSFRLKDIKFVDNKSKLLMHGYLRALYDNSNDEHIILELILTISLLFYYQREYFAILVNGKADISPNFRLSDDKTTIYLNDKCYGTLYGNIIIDSLSEIICQWNIQLQNVKEGTLSDTRLITVGLSGDEPAKEDLDLYNTVPPNTFLCSQNDVYYPKDEYLAKNSSLNWNDNDIIGIKLNLKEKNIEYFINDESVGIVFENIAIGKEIKYRLVMTMECDGHSATIKSHQYLSQ